MAEEKTVKIKPLVDIVYDGQNHRKGSEPFDIPEQIAKRLVSVKKAEEVK